MLRLGRRSAGIAAIFGRVRRGPGFAHQIITVFVGEYSRTAEEVKFYFLPAVGYLGLQSRHLCSAVRHHIVPSSSLGYVCVAFRSEIDAVIVFVDKPDIVSVSEEIIAVVEPQYAGLSNWLMGIGVVEVCHHLSMGLAQVAVSGKVTR